MLKTKKFFVNKEAAYDLDREEIDGWTKNQKERFMEMADNFGNAVSPNMVQPEGREGYLNNRDNEEHQFVNGDGKFKDKE